MTSTPPEASGPPRGSRPRRRARPRHRRRRRGPAPPATSSTTSDGSAAPSRTARLPASPAGSPATSTSTRSSCGWPSWSAFFGDAGLILYGACWLLLPEEGNDSATARTQRAQPFDRPHHRGISRPGAVGRHVGNVPLPLAARDPRAGGPDVLHRRDRSARPPTPIGPPSPYGPQPYAGTYAASYPTAGPTAGSTTDPARARPPTRQRTRAGSEPSGHRPCTPPRLRPSTLRPAPVRRALPAQARPDPLLVHARADRSRGGHARDRRHGGAGVADTAYPPWPSRSPAPCC